MELEFIDISRPEHWERPIEERKRPPKRRTTAARRGNHAQRAREIELQRQQVLRNRKRKRRRLMIKGVIVLCELGFIIVLCFLLYHLIRSVSGGKEKGQDVVQAVNDYRMEMIKANDTHKPEIIENFLTINEYSRPGEKLQKVNNLFVHYTANPGTSAAQNRSYFENLGITGETSASAHFVIGYDGEIVQCIPLDEIAYAVMQRNYDSISIECCYLQEDGKFTDATYQSLIQLSAWLLKEYDLAPEDMRRHYDEGGKKCPLYFVEHEEAWRRFIADLEEYIMKEQI